MRKLLEMVLGVVLFFALSAFLLQWAVPWYTSERYTGGADDNVMSNFPVLVVVPEAPNSTRQKFIVAHWHTLERETAKASNFSFLVPAGHSKIVDQDGDPASFSAEEISSGRQRIRLEAKVGEYIYWSEYEAEDKRVFPRRVSFTGPQMGITVLPVSLLLTWAVFRLTRRFMKRAN